MCRSRGRGAIPCGKHPSVVYDLLLGFQGFPNVVLMEARFHGFLAK